MILRSIGSRVTREAFRNAENVSLGSDGIPAPIKGKSTVRGSTHPGNPAGLNNEKSARLNPEGVGYDNPASQKRHSRSFKELDSPIKTIKPKNNTIKGSNLDLRSIESKLSSAQILKKR